MKHLSFLKGHTIELCAIDCSDIELENWCHWYNDQDVTRYNSHGVFPVTQDEELQYLKTKSNNQNEIMLAIVGVEDKRVVGNVSIQRIDWVNRHCELAITVGEATSVSAGVEALGLLSAHAFNRLNLNCIRGASHEKLDSWIDVLSVIGFKKDGRMRDYYLRNGKSSDIILFSLLREDYEKLVLERGNSFLFHNQEELVKAITASVGRRKEVKK